MRYARTLRAERFYRSNGEPTVRFPAGTLVQVDDRADRALHGSPDQFLVWTKTLDGIYSRLIWDHYLQKLSALELLATQAKQ